MHDTISPSIHPTPFNQGPTPPPPRLPRLTPRVRFWYTIGMKIDNYLKIANGLVMTHLATGIPNTITLNAKEIQLATSKTDIDKCWLYMCKSVQHRLGVWIEGDYSVDAIIVNGTTKDFH